MMVPASSTRPSWSQQPCSSDEVGTVGSLARGCRLGQPGGGHVEEPVEVDAQRTVVDAAQQLGRRRSLERLVQRVGGGEGVVHLVPVAVIVLRVEPGDAQRGGVGDGAAERLGVDPGGDGLVDGRDDVGRLLGQQ